MTTGRINQVTILLAGSAGRLESPTSTQPQLDPPERIEVSLNQAGVTHNKEYTPDR